MQIKRRLRTILFGSDLWYLINLMRRTPEILHWLRFECNGVAPHPIKMMVAKSYIKRFDTKHFVETGTYLGETLGYVARHNIKGTRIELSPELYRAACRHFRVTRTYPYWKGMARSVCRRCLRPLRTHSLLAGRPL